MSGLEPLETFATVVGRGITPRYATDGDFTVFNQKCVRDGSVNSAAARRHDSTTRPVPVSKRLSSGDCLVNSTGQGTLGRTGYVGGLEGDATVDSHVTIVRPHPNTDSRWLAYALRMLEPTIEDLAIGSTGQTELPRDALASLPIPSVSRGEQQAIAEVLGALDDKIAANTALAATAEQLLRTEIDAFWLRSSDRSSTLSDFVELNPKVAVPLAESVAYIDMKRLPESGWSVDGFDYREPKGGARFRNGDTLLARITPCLENRKAGFVDHLPEGQAGVGSTEFIVLRARAGVAPPISFLLATATRFREHAIQHMVGTSGRQRVAASDLASFELPTPDPDWLKNFGSRAIAVFELVASQTLERRTLAATRDALLPQLMSGKLRVRDAEDLIVQAGV